MVEKKSSSVLSPTPVLWCDPKQATSSQHAPDPFCKRGPEGFLWWHIPVACPHPLSGFDHAVKSWWICSEHSGTPVVPTPVGLQVPNVGCRHSSCSNKAKEQVAKDFSYPTCYFTLPIATFPTAEVVCSAWRTVQPHRLSQCLILPDLNSIQLSLCVVLFSGPKIWVVRSFCLILFQANVI